MTNKPIATEIVDPKRLTPWFTVDDKPEIAGVYETRDWVLCGWSYWTGDAWCIQREKRADAAKDDEKRPLSRWQAKEWRGLQPDDEEVGAEVEAEVEITNKEPAI